MIRRLISGFLAFAMILVALCAPGLADTVLILPADTEMIEAEAFMGDMSLDRVECSDKLRQIGARAFANSSLTEILLPNSLTLIAEDAFEGSPNVTIQAPAGSYAYKWAVDHDYLEPVTLTMGSWRADDTEKVTALLNQYEELTGVKIEFQPTKSYLYNATLRQQLEEGTAPDLFYSRTFSTGAELSENGYDVACNSIPDIQNAFTPFILEGFTDANGNIFAVPIAGVSDFVYYNKDIFADQGIEVPSTFEAFLAVCQQLKDAGIQPLSNGIASNWDILECVLCGMIPNYITADERLAYENGTKKMNDATWARIYSDFASLAAYLPENYAFIDNVEAGALFGQSQSAMVIDGSWSYDTFAGDYQMNVGFFPIPAPAGYSQGFSLHPDYGIAGNAASAHPEEVKAFLEWLVSADGAHAAASIIPAGYLPLRRDGTAPQSGIVARMTALSRGKNADMRFMWNMLPLYNPMLDELNAICRGEQTPQGAANSINALWEAELAR